MCLYENTVYQQTFGHDTVCLGSSDILEKSCFRLALYSNWAENDQKLLCVGFCFQKIGGDLGLCRFLSLFLWVGIWHTLVIIIVSALIRTHWTAAGVCRLHKLPMLYFNFQSITAMTNKLSYNTISYVTVPSLTST